MSATDDQRPRGKPGRKPKAPRSGYSPEEQAVVKRISAKAASRAKRMETQRRVIQEERMAFHRLFREGEAAGLSSDEMGRLVGMSRSMAHREFLRLPTLIERGAKLGYKATTMAERMGYGSAAELQDAVEAQQQRMLDRRERRGVSADQAA